jgi:hypothetical protein
MRRALVWLSCAADLLRRISRKICLESAGMLLTWVRAIIVAVIFTLPVGAARAEAQWYYTGFLGVMTENVWYEVFSPGSIDFAGSGLVGVGLGWERPIGNSRFSYGLELQAVSHFGRQDHFEFNLPVVLRYRPENPVLPRLHSVAFGLGISHATKIPRVETDRKGTSTRNFVYWMADMEFTLPRPDTSMYVRLHHRSDGYGFYDVSGGSTGVVFGWRKAF